MMNLNLSSKDIAALDKRTEGWIAGLLAWCQAFEDWMQDRRERRHDSI